MIYQKKALDELAIYYFVRIEFISGMKRKGWLVPFSEKAGFPKEKPEKCEYILLSIDGTKIAFTRGCIKEIKYDFDGYTIPYEIYRRK